MTFAARPLGFDVLQGVQNPLATMTVRDVKPFVNASAAIIFASGGSITYVGNQSTGPTRWYEPATTGIGNGYWIKFTLTSGAAWDSGPVDGTLYQLSSSRSLTWSATAGTSKTAVVTVQIYSDAGGTTLVSSGTMNVYSSGMN